MQEATLTRAPVPSRRQFAAPDASPTARLLIDRRALAISAIARGRLGNSIVRGSGRLLQSPVQSRGGRLVSSRTLNGLAPRRAAPLPPLACAALMRRLGARVQPTRSGADNLISYCRVLWRLDSSHLPGGALVDTRMSARGKLRVRTFEDMKPNLLSSSPLSSSLFVSRHSHPHVLLSNSPRCVPRLHLHLSSRVETSPSGQVRRAAVLPH